MKRLNYSEMSENDFLIDLENNTIVDKVNGYTCVYTYRKNVGGWRGKLIKKPDNVEHHYSLSAEMCLRYIFLKEKHKVYLKKIADIMVVSVLVIIFANIFLFLEDGYYRYADIYDYLINGFYPIFLLLFSKLILRNVLDYFVFSVRPSHPFSYIISFNKFLIILLVIHALIITYYAILYKLSLDNNTMNHVFYYRMVGLYSTIVFFSMIYFFLGWKFDFWYHNNIK